MRTNGSAAPVMTFNVRRSRQRERYLEKIKMAVPVKSNPGCQHKHESIEQTPAQNGLSLAISKMVSIPRSEEHTSELQSLAYLVCRLLLEKKKIKINM